jgi:hypothetical protein
MRMELFMNGFYRLAIAPVVTASLASHLLAIVTRGPASRDALARLRLGLRRSPRHAKRLVDIWVAGILARRERQAAVGAHSGSREAGRAGAFASPIKRGGPR